MVNLPPNPYHLEVTVSGFGVFSQDVDIRSSLPVEVKATLVLAGANTTLTVEGVAEALENDPSAHVDVDRNQFLKLPIFDPAGGLSQAIIYSTGGVAADANGFFHPLGDHAQTTFIIDGQPISDQQSKLFSTQLPTNAIQSMEATTGTPSAEFGDKSSLVAQITTRSGLGSGRVFGSVDAIYGAFGTTGGGASLGWGGKEFGNFIAIEGIRSGRFLDTPEFTPFHDKGTTRVFSIASIFNQMTPMSSISIYSARGTGSRSQTITISWAKINISASLPGVSRQGTSTHLALILF